MSSSEDVSDLRGLVYDCRMVLKHLGIEERAAIMRRIDFVLNTTSGRLPEDYHIVQDDHGRWGVYRGMFPERISDYYYDERKIRIFCWIHASERENTEQGKEEEHG